MDPEDTLGLGGRFQWVGTGFGFLGGLFLGWCQSKLGASGDRSVRTWGGFLGAGMIGGGLTPPFVCLGLGWLGVFCRGLFWRVRWVGIVLLALDLPADGCVAIAGSVRAGSSIKRL